MLLIGTLANASSERLKTIALGYGRAYRRVTEAQVAAYRHLPNTTLLTFEAEATWAALFEALNWLDALLLRPEVKAIMDSELRDALMFVRGTAPTSSHESALRRPPSALVRGFSSVAVLQTRIALDRDLARLVELLYDEEAARPLDDAGGLGVLMTRQNEEATGVRPDGFVFRDGRLEHLRAVRPAALADEAELLA